MKSNENTNVGAATINYQFTAIPTNLFLMLDNNCRSTLFSLIQLSSYYAKEDGYFFRTNSDLEFETNLSKNVVNASLDALYINGIIDVIPSAKGKGKKQSGKRFKVNFDKFLEYESISIEEAMKNEELKICTPNYKGTYTPSFNNVTNNDTKCNTTLVTTSVPSLVTSLVPTLVTTLVKSDNNINNIDNKENKENIDNINNKKEINNNIYNKENIIEEMSNINNNKEDLFDFGNNFILNKNKEEFNNRISKLINSNNNEEAQSAYYSIIGLFDKLSNKYNFVLEDEIMNQIDNKLNSLLLQVKSKFVTPTVEVNPSSAEDINVTPTVEVEEKTQIQLIEEQLGEKLDRLANADSKDKYNLYLNAVAWVSNLCISDAEQERLGDWINDVYTNGTTSSAIGNNVPQHDTNTVVSSTTKTKRDIPSLEDCFIDSGIGYHVEDEYPF